MKSIDLLGGSIEHYGSKAQPNANTKPPGSSCSRVETATIPDFPVA